MIRRWVQGGCSYGIGGFGLAMNGMQALMIPLWGLHLGFSEAEIGVLVGIGSLAPIVLSVHTGSFVDRVGPTRAFLVGVAVSTGLALLLPIATSFLTIATIQLLLGGSRNLSWLASQTYATALETTEVADGRPPGRTGRFSAIANLGTLVGPLMVGIAVDELGTSRGFLVMGGYAAVFLLVGAVLPALDRPDPGERVPLRVRTQTGVLLRRPRFRAALVFVFVRLWVHGVWTTFYPVLLVQGGRGATFAASMLATRAGVATVLSWGTGTVQRLVGGTRVLIPASLVVGVLGVITSGVVPLDHWLVALPAVLVGISSGLSLPLLLLAVGDAAPAEHRGLGFGLRNTVSQSANAAAPALTGLLAGAIGLRPTFVVGAAIATGLIVWGVRLGGRPSPDQAPQTSSIDRA